MPRLVDRIVLGIAGGLGGLILALLTALFRALLPLLSGQSVSLEGLWPAMAYYAAGWLLLGLIIAIAWPLARFRFGIYLLGILGMAFLVGAIIWVDAGPPWGWTPANWQPFAIMVSAFGLALGFGLLRAFATLRLLEPTTRT